MNDKPLKGYQPDEPAYPLPPPNPGSELPFSKERQLYPVQGECGCGCELVGALRRKRSRDGTQHVRGCKCWSCQGSRNRTGGLRKQRVAAKALGIPSAKFYGQNGNEENWRGVFRVEVKSGKQVGHAAWFFRAEAQSPAAIGDSRPFAFVAMPEGLSDGLVTIRLSVWESEIVPRLEA